MLVLLDTSQNVLHKKMQTQPTTQTHVTMSAKLLLMPTGLVQTICVSAHVLTLHWYWLPTPK